MYDRFNLLARTYLDHQHLRVACEHRVIKIVKKLIGKEREATYSSLVDEYKMLLEEKKMEKDPIIEILLEYRDMIHREEVKVLKSSQELMRDEKLWVWCKSVKGLGSVALMTFLGFIDPYKANSAGNVWAYLGFTPTSRLKSGEKGGFNPEAKGRFWLLSRNVIMARDPYYTALYKAKKEYYLNRPDLVEEKDKKGWKGHIDNMAKRWLTKLLISHAWEIIRKSEGLLVNPHHSYIPPKPENLIQFKLDFENIIRKLLKGER